MSRSLSLSNFVGDLYGGLTAAIIALPLALAFGIASGLGAAAGLYGAIALGFVAALFGGTPTQISGPTGPMTVVMATILVSLHGNLSLVMGTIFLAGLIQVAFGVFKIGGVVKYVPYPVISGFMSGIGVIIIILQINPFLDVDSHGKALQTLLSLPSSFAHMKVESAILGLLTLCIVLFTPMKISRFLPSPLIALFVGSFGAFYFDLDVSMVSDIPRTLPSLTLPHFSLATLTLMFTSAITLAVLGTIDSLLTSLVADSITKTKHKSNQELIGQGLGNMAASLIGGIPGAGATMRTVINVKSGGRTRLSGVIHALVLLAILLALAPMAEYLPLCVLSAILIKVGLDILDYKMIRYIKAAPKHDLAVMVTVFVLTVFVDLIVAVGAGIVLASILITYRLSRAVDIDIGSVDESAHSDRMVTESIRVIHINGAFFFGSATQIIDKVDAIFDVKGIILDVSKVPFIDVSAIFALEEMVAKLKANDIFVFMVLKEAHKQKLINMGFTKSLPQSHLVTSQLEALIFSKNMLHQNDL